MITQKIIPFFTLPPLSGGEKSIPSILSVLEAMIPENEKSIAWKNVIITIYCKTIKSG